MNTLTLGITCYDKDFYLLNNLLFLISKQTEKPNKVIISCSGLDGDFINYANFDLDITLFNSKSRHNQAIARNICIKNCQTDLLMFFDVDDIPHPQKIEITKTIFSNDELNALVHNYQINDSFFIPINNFPKLQNIIEKNPFNTNVKCGNHDIHHAHLTVDRSVMNKILFKEDPIYYRCEDGKYCQDIIDGGFKLKYLDLKLVNYTV